MLLYIIYTMYIYVCIMHGAISIDHPSTTCSESQRLFAISSFACIISYYYIHLYKC